ncbi:L-serine ammonia-lyase [Mycolicibacterium moriokaense]|nr:L-serine ammonia-lyase [Mycolicibacterium moriokaense]
MTISVFELFKVGIGPSSSHTVGPMRGAANFVDELDAMGVLLRVADVRVELYGSLAATGRGHGTLPAVLLGLEGYRPETIEPEDMEAGRERLRSTGKIMLGGRVPIALSEDDIAMYPRTVLDFHPNGMTLCAYAADDSTLHRRTYFSVGGGFVVTEGFLVTEDEAQTDSPATGAVDGVAFSSAAELLALTSSMGSSVSDVMLAHECRLRSEEEVRTGLLHLRDVMVDCERRGIGRSGLLPGVLQVRRRAGQWYQRISQEDPHRDPRFAQDWVNLVALAVNEENASGGRVVTAPTNGAAGIIPAVLHYAVHYTDAGCVDADDVAVRFLLAAGAIGSLFKEQASISGAEVGCQGEVGSASSMAAAGLAEILGGTPQQLENAAEIAMEHSLGLTCDPIAGLVQIPCIERNAISAGKAINAARMALRGDGNHRVSLDQVIATMRATGRDMSAKYKETSTGGLAVNVPLNYVDC